MKKITFLLIFIPKIIFCQNFSTSASLDSITLCIATTTENTRLKGKLAMENVEQITVIDLILGEVTVSKKNVRYFEKINPGAIFEIEYGNKSSVRGKIESIDKNRWKISTLSLGVVEIKSSDIKDFYEVSHTGSTVLSIDESGNIDPGKYFAGPSPFTIKKKALVFHDTYVLLNDISYGLSNEFSISAGLLYIYIPYGNFKYATEITHNLHISGGIMGGGLPIIGLGNSIPFVGSGYGMLAYGNADHHISAGAYYPFYGSFLGSNYNNVNPANNVIFSYNGILKISRNLALMTENYVIPFTRTVYNYYPYNSSPTFRTTYVNAGAAGLKIFLKRGLNGTPAVLNIGILYITNSNANPRSNSNNFVAFPILSYSHRMR